MRFQLLFLLFTAVSSEYGSTEKSIWTHFKGTADDIKFKPGNFETANVTMDLWLHSLTDFEPKAATIEANFWLFLRWETPRLKWDPEQFGGVKKIHIPTSKVWVPDVIPYGVKYSENQFENLVVITNTGEASWAPHIFSRFFCEPVVDGPAYPNDKMICLVKFASWTRDGLSLNLTLKENVNKTLKSHFIENALLASGWKFVSGGFTREVANYPCCIEPYPSVFLKLTIQRRYQYYALTTTGPGVVCGLVAAILYLLPPSSPGRVVSQSVCLFIVTYIAISEIRMIDRTISTAPLVNYFLGVMTLDLFAILWSVIAAVIWNQCSDSGKHGRTCFDSLTAKLERICCLPSVNVKDDRQEIKLSDEENEYRNQRPYLSTIQRLCLAMDRLFCLITIIILSFLFIFLST